MRSRHASRACEITTSDFTPDSRDEAHITNVIIMNGQGSALFGIVLSRKVLPVIAFYKEWFLGDAHYLVVCRQKG